MVQEVITYILVVGAFVIAGVKIYRALPFSKKNTAGGKCGSCATGCALKDLKSNPECPSADHVKIYL